MCHGRPARARGLTGGRTSLETRANPGTAAASGRRRAYEKLTCRNGARDVYTLQSAGGSPRFRAGCAARPAWVNLDGSGPHRRRRRRVRVGPRGSRQARGVHGHDGRDAAGSAARARGRTARHTCSSTCSCPTAPAWTCSRASSRRPVARGGADHRQREPRDRGRRAAARCDRLPHQAARHGPAEGHARRPRAHVEMKDQIGSLRTRAAPARPLRAARRRLAADAEGLRHDRARRARPRRRCSSPARRAPARSSSRRRSTRSASAARSRSSRSTAARSPRR